MLVPLLIEPDPEDVDCATLCVDGHVDGRAARFVLDTGAARSQIVANNGVPVPLSSAGGTSTGVFGASSSGTTVVSELRVGSTKASNLTVDVVGAVGPRPRHLLGLDFLGSHSLTVNFDEQLVGIDAPPPAAPAWRNLHLGVHGHPHLEMHWPGADASAVWDTGAGMTIVSEQFHAAHRRLFTEVGVTTGTDASGRQQQTPAYLVAPCHIGTLAFTSHRVAVIDLARIGAGDIDVILGYPALRQANWHVDFPLRRWFIRPRCSRIS